MLKPEVSTIFLDGDGTLWDFKGAMIQGLRRVCGILREEIDCPDARRITPRDLMTLRDTVASHGCPVGSLAQELNKEHSPLAQQADHLLKAHLDWVRKQFRELGRADADDLGLQMIATLQGVSLLCNALRDPVIVDRQIKRLRAWLEAL